jgi:hypothetical protein
MKAALSMGLLGCEATLFYFMLAHCKVQNLITTVDANSTQADSMKIVERLKVLAALETGSDFKFTVTPNSLPGATILARPYRESFSGTLDVSTANASSAPKGAFLDKVFFKQGVDVSAVDKYCEVKNIRAVMVSDSTFSMIGSGKSSTPEEVLQGDSFCWKEIKFHAQMGGDYEEIAEVIETLEFETIEILTIVSNHNKLVPDLMNPLEKIPETYWPEVDKAISAVEKLKNTRTVLWSFGCNEKVWGYSGGAFNHNAIVVRKYVADAFLVPYKPVATVESGSLANATTGHVPTANASGMVPHKNTPIFIDVSELMEKLIIP